MYITLYFNVLSTVQRKNQSTDFLFLKLDCDKTCRDLLQQVQKNPPTKSAIDIRIGLCKARYRCYKGFRLVGKEIRTCKGGAWIEKKEPKCYGILNSVQLLVAL